MVKLKVGHDLKSMEKIQFNSIAVVTEFNSIQKYYQQQQKPGIILRELRSIYARNNQLYTSNIIHTF